MTSSAPSGSSLTRWQAGSISVGAATIVLVALVIVLHAAVLLVGGVVHPATSAVALLAVVAGLWWSRRDASRTERVVLVIAFLAVVALAVTIAAVTVDVTWDGNAYHKLAIGELRAGWNPVYSDAATFDALPTTEVRLVPDTWLWVDHYPKGSWIFGAAVAQVFGYIEVSKSFGLLVAAALGLIAWGYATARLGRVRGTVIAVLLVVNPISTAQIFSNYVDGTLGNLMILVIVVLSGSLDPGWEAPAWWRLARWPTVGAALIVLANLKFTGLFFAGLVGVVYLGALALRPRRDRGALLGLAVTGAVAAVVGVGVVGASSYIRNWVVDGHPLTPLFGDTTADVLAIGGEPAYVEGRDRVSAFLLSVFSSSSSDGVTTSLKIPFTFTVDELRMFNWVDVRIGGYGVLFGGILLVAALVATLAIVRMRRRAVPYLPLFLAPVVIVAANVLVDGSWWARYVPVLGVLPLLAVVAWWSSGRGAFTRLVGWLAVLVIAANVGWILFAQARQQAAEWRNPPLADQVAAGGCDAVYPGTTFTGLAFNAVDLVPGVRVLTPDEYRKAGADSFVAATPRAWLNHPLLVQTAC